MSANHWLNDINGSFTNAANWSGGVVPGATDDAILDAVGSAFTVTSAVDEMVGSVQLASNATLSLTAGVFTAEGGTGSGANAGIILIGAGATMVTSGTLTNTGTIALDGSVGSAGQATLVFGSPSTTTTLSGGGEILLAGAGDDELGRSRFSEGYATYLLNVDNRIVGSGTIASRLLIHNDQGGLIDASGDAALIDKGGIYNEGLVEATGPGGLVFRGLYAAIQSSADGVVLVADGSKLKLNFCLVFGGTLEAAGSGRVIASNSLFEGFADDPTIIDANIKAINGPQMADFVDNNGTMSMSGYSPLFLDNAVTLGGDGVIALAGNSLGAITHYSALMLSSGTIRGSGSLVREKFQFPLTIGAAGVIEGYGATGVTLAATSIVNAGTIEGTGAGGMVVEDPILNSGTLSVQRGTFQVEGAVSGGGEAVIGRGTMEFLSSFNEAVTFAGSGTLSLAQSQGFTNAVTGFAYDGATKLDLRDIGFVDAGEATFSGTASGGVLTVTDGAHAAKISLKGNYLNATFVAKSDGGGGTEVATQKANRLPASIHAFVAAMAGLVAPAGQSVPTRGPREERAFLLSSPRVAIA